MSNITPAQKVTIRKKLAASAESQAAAMSDAATTEAEITEAAYKLTQDNIAARREAKRNGTEIPDLLSWGDALAAAAVAREKAAPATAPINDQPSTIN